MMRIISLLTIMIAFSFLGRSAGMAPPPSCPKVIFYNADPLAPYQTFNVKDVFYGNCGDGKVHFELASCEKSMSPAYQLDHVVWNMGTGSPVTTTSMDIFYTYAATGQYQVTAQVFFNIDGQSCNIPAVVVQEAGAQSFSELCNRTTTTAYVTLDVIVFNWALDVNPANVTLYTNTPVSIKVNYSGAFLSGPVTYNLLVDGAPAVTASISALPVTNNIVIQNDYYAAGQHVAEIIAVPTTPGNCPLSASVPFEIDTPDCNLCFTFKPDLLQHYWVTAWVKEEVASQVLSYSNLVSMQLECLGNGQLFNFYPAGDIIDGWQRIAGDFTVPTGTTDLKINLVNQNASIAAYFDDVRIHPFNGSMKSYVYDPETFWLTAELDDNNYATFYEYDKEGQLIRIKKETEKGIRTIQESRSSNPKTN